MKYLIVTPGYPSEDNMYNNNFIHSRVKLYQKKGLEVDVFSTSNKKSLKYNFDDVNVTQGSYDELANVLKENEYTKILVHFGWQKIMTTIIKNVTPCTPIIVWVHGVEALGWYRRLFNLDSNILNLIKFGGYAILNTKQMLFMRTLILNADKYNVHFVFVSHWMKDILEKDTLTIGRIKNYDIIPNVIDDSIFNYIKKDIKQRFKVFNIRPYHSKKYANDVMVDTIIELSKRPVFNKLEFNLYGDGRLFNKITSRIKHLDNVNIHKGFLTQDKIAEKHKTNGILLMPTRQDAQGVSMCEAMSSGLVPVVSNNTAIPEYVNNDIGYLCNNYIEMADAIEELTKQADTFAKKSVKASGFIQNKCSQLKVTEMEIKILKK
ncbi:MAG: glycosyltransferase family 4 protein [Bacilli bacterium]|nr:glycosyltransferase family 4 protein [Bacilli bacterium]